MMYLQLSRRELSLRATQNQPRKIWLMAAIFATVMLPVTAHAVLDQQQTHYVGGQQIRNNDSYATTFTAGLTGELHQIELVAGPNNLETTIPLIIEIRDTNLDGSPSTNVLATTSMIAADFPSSGFN